MTKITLQQLEKSTIKSEDFVACANAFIDCRTPGSDKKENYSMIGPGVTQSSDQFVNLAEKHGFNIGGAAMPKECTNSLHIHFTAETFYIHKGEWEFIWGNKGENRKIFAEGTVFSPKTWLFRAFENVGDDDGFIFTVLGKDDTGGIIWHPDVLTKAEGYGLLLTAENKVIDTIENPELTKTNLELIDKMTEEQMKTLRQPSPDEMLQQAVEWDELKWSEHALLSKYTNNGNVRMAPVIGWGMTEDRNMVPKIYNPHGYSIEWLEIPAGQSVKLHKIDERQVLKMHKGAIEITLNRPEDSPVSGSIKAKDVFSVPAGCWRTFENTDSETAYVLVINAEDNVNRITWDKSIIEEANKNGYSLDVSGYIALADLIKYSNPML